LSGNKYLIVIAGPTAVGKTAVAIEVANYFNTDIVSADSRQMFKEMNIGTAKPSFEQLRAVKHHFINSHHIIQPMNMGLYEIEALPLLASLFEKNNYLVLAGGTGLYIDAVLYGVDDLPQADAALREERVLQLKEKGIEYFASILKTVDETTYSAIDIKNPRRVLRALEVFELTGQPYSTFLNKNKTKRNFIPLLFCLDKKREVLYSDIDKRVDSMILEGLEEEVKSLIPYRQHNGLQTVGYKEFFDFFDGQQSYEETIALIKKNTRNYAKRQLTWFRRYEDMHWIESNTSTAEVILNKIPAD